MSPTSTTCSVGRRLSCRSPARSSKRSRRRRRKMTANSAEVIRFPVRPDREPGRIEVDYLTEPFLLFGEGGLHVDPKSGIDRYGPRSYGTSLHPRNVRVGIIGTAELSEIAQSWTARNAVGVAGDETNRSFPGFAPDRGFFSSLGFDDGWNATVSQTEMAGVIGIRSQRDRFGEAVKLIEGKLSLIAERDQPPDYVAIVISEELLQRCGVADYFDKAKGAVRSEEHTSELQSRENLVCRLL